MMNFTYLLPKLDCSRIASELDRNIHNHYQHHFSATEYGATKIWVFDFQEILDYVKLYWS